MVVILSAAKDMILVLRADLNDKHFQSPDRSEGPLMVSPFLNVVTFVQGP